MNFYDVLYSKTRKSWGGATVNTRTAEFLADGIDAYAVTVRPDSDTSITVPETACALVVMRAFQAAQIQWPDAPYIGVFHDDDARNIQFDPVTVVNTTAEVDALYQESPFSGGAYHFATGNGYWPNS